MSQPLKGPRKDPTNLGEKKPKRTRTETTWKESTAEQLRLVGIDRVTADNVILAASIVDDDDRERFLAWCEKQRKEDLRLLAPRLIGIFYRSEVAQRDAVIAQRDAVIVERDAVIAQVIVERDELAQDNRELEITYVQSTVGMLAHNAEMCGEVRQWIANSWAGDVPSPRDMHKLFVDALVIGELWTSLGRQISANAKAWCRDADKHFRRVFFQEKIKGKTETETVTQRFWTALIRAVHTHLLSSKKPAQPGSMVLDVHDTSSMSFVGAGQQPDISLLPLDLPCCTFSSIKKVVELKTQGNRRGAIRQAFSRARDVRLMKSAKEYEMEVAVADDTQLDLLRCSLLSKSTNIYSLLTVKLVAEKWSDVFHAIRALLSPEWVSGPPTEACGRPSANSGRPDCPVIQTIQPSRSGKPLVTLNKKFDSAGIPKFVVVKRCGNKGSYDAEKANLQAVTAAMVRCKVKYPDITYEDSNFEVIMDAVGHRIQLRTGEEVERAHKVLSAQLSAVHSADIYHADISPRNLIMCVDLGQVNMLKDQIQKEARKGPADDIEKRLDDVTSVTSSLATKLEVEYYLIDWGEAETVESDRNQKRAVTLQCSYPLALDASPKAKKDRDVFALNCSLILLYIESFRLGGEWMWLVEDTHFGNPGIETAHEAMTKYLERRDTVLANVAKQKRREGLFPQYLVGLAQKCCDIWKGAATEAYNNISHY